MPGVPRGTVITASGPESQGYSLVLDDSQLEAEVEGSG